MFFWLLFDVVAVVISIADAEFFCVFIVVVLLLYHRGRWWCRCANNDIAMLLVVVWIVFLFVLSLFIYLSCFLSFSTVCLLLCVCLRVFFCCFLLARNICLFDFWSHFLVRVHTQWKKVLKSNSWTSVQTKDFSMTPLQFNNNRSLFCFCCNSIEITSIYIFLSVCMFMCLIHQVWWFPNEYKQPYYCYFNVIDAVVNLNNASLNRMAFLTDNLVFPKASKTNTEPEKQQKFTNKNEKMNRSYFAEFLKMYVLSYRRRWAEDSILIEDFFIAIHKVWAKKNENTINAAFQKP